MLAAQQATLAPTAGAAAAPGQDSAAAAPVGYWKYAVFAAMACLTVVGVRVHEGLPFLYPFRLAFLTAYLGSAIVVANTRPAALKAAFRMPLVRLVLAYFGWAALGVPFALFLGAAKGAVQAAIPTMLMMLLVVLSAPTRQSVDRMLRGLVVATVVMAVYSKMTGRMVMEFGNARLSGLGTFDPNDLAAVCALCVPMAVGQATRGRGIWRLAFAAGAAALVAVLIATSSRGGLIALGVSTLVYILGQPGPRKFSFLALGAVAGLIAWQTAPESFRHRMLSIGEEDYNYTSYFGRKQIWSRARGYAIENPVFGVGMGNFTVAEGITCTRLEIGGCKWSAPHNAYYQAAAELGIPGGLMFVGLLLLGARTGYRLWRPPIGPGARARMHRPELMAAILGFAASAVFLSHAYFYLLFGLLGLIAVADVALRREALAAAGGLALPGAGGGALAPPERPRGMRGGALSGGVVAGVAGGPTMGGVPRMRGGLAR